MIKTWLIDALRNIQKRIVSWLSIVTIVLIGTTLILGLYFGSTTVKKASMAYINGQNFKDFDVSCSMGIQEEDIESIKELENVKDAEGQISFSAVATMEKNSAGVTVISATERISIPTVNEGKLPSSSDECAVSLSALRKMGASIGDEIEISVSTARFANVLSQGKYKITGIASHPDYMVNISTDYIVLPFSSFDTTDLSFDYSNVLVDADMPADPFKSEYKKTSTAIEEVLKDKTTILSEDRKIRINDELEKEYANARDKAEEELSKGKSELDKAKETFNETITAAKEQLDKGELDLNDLKDKAQKELAEAKRKITEGEEEYNTKLIDGQAQLEQAEKDMEKELENARWQIFDGFLQIDQNEKLLGQKEAEYQAAVERLAWAKGQLEEGWDKYNSGVNELGSKISPQAISDVVDILNNFTDVPGVTDLIDRLNNAASSDPIDRADQIIYIYDSLWSGIEIPDDDRKKIDEIVGVDRLRSAVQELRSGKEQLEDGQRQYDDGVEALEEGRKLLDQGWFSLSQAKVKLAEGQAEYDRREPEARKQLEDAKNEYEQKKAEGAQQLEDAKKELASKTAEAQDTIKKLEDEFFKAKEEYTSKKEEGEKEISEATEKYEQGRREADEKMAEYRKQIDEALSTPCRYMVRPRDVNAPYVQTKSFVKAISGFFGVFTPLYSAIIAVVCFFTMTIIIEEQTSQIGTCKAFGMRESEIMRKYLVFGTAAALFGAIAGVIGAFLVEKKLIDTMKDNMAFSLDGTGHNIVMIVLLPAIEVLITVVAVLWSCHRYIKCSAVGLINGSEPAKRYRTKSARKHIGSLYTNLIINNLFTDIGREIISVVTIVMCVFIVGFGIDVKLAYEGALARQMKDIWQFDLTLTESGKITDEEKAAIKKELDSYETLYLPITAGVISAGDSRVLTSIICVDDKEAFEKFYVLRDYDGKDVDIFDDGVLVTQEMKDKNDLTEGSNVSMFNSSLNRGKVDVKGIFMLYAGKTVLMTNDYYREVFESDPVTNTYYIKAPDADKTQLMDRLSELPGVSSVELTSNLRDRNLAVVNIYNAVVVIVILFSVLLSFMILLNLSNILVAHRMRELLTMRVNGFSNAHVIGYLVREVVLIGVLSFTIAVGLGVAFTGNIVKNMETDAFMFVRQPFALAWIASVLINTLFSVTINAIAFRKVRKVPLTDINKY